MDGRRIRLPLFGVATLIAAILVPPVNAATSIPTIDDAELNPLTTTVGGASPLPTGRTVQHWFGQTTNPHDGVTYGYNMVGADPNNCSGNACSVTIETDVTPLVVNIDGLAFNGNDVLAATLASPQFALSDYGSTPAATVPGAFPNEPSRIRGKGGTLSQGDAKNQLQLEDATMRAQFNRTGSSGYHLRLHANVLPARTIDVPNNQGFLRQSERGVVLAVVNVSWWFSQINNLVTTGDATHLPIYLANDVVGIFPSGLCCLIGYHGANRNSNSNGNAVVQTFIEASWVQAGVFALPNGGSDWALQDIHVLSHEVAEWANDPFVNNAVEPWQTATAPLYGCTGLLETGDPVVEIGFAMGKNTFGQGPNPDGTQSADGYYHPEDEAFLPWFMRMAPNTVSEPTQKTSANIGRYTFMGDLNPFPEFRQPATGC